MTEEQPFIDTFREALTKIAEKLNLSPRMVPVETFYKHRPGFNKRVVDRELGTFTEARDAAFPPEPNPLKDHEKHTHDQLQEIIASLIEECCEVLKVNAWELTWSEFKRHINFRFGTNDGGLSSYAITKAGGFNAVRDAFFPLKATPQTVNKIRTQEHARINRKLGREESQTKFIEDELSRRLEKTFSKAYNVQICCKPPMHGKCNQTLLVVLSDLHFGSDILASETGVLNYGATEERRRVARIAKDVAEFDPANRSTTEVVILLNGDIIQGQLHDPRDGAVIAEQIERAMHILVQFICWVAGHFPKVTVYIETGNHDRITSRHKTRAINQKWDSYMYIIGNSLMYAIKANTKNVEFNMPKTPFVTFEVQGQKVFATHGDTVLSLGYSTIPVSALANQTTRINSTLPGDQIYDVYIAGHIHLGTYAALPNGSNLYTNASIVPPDAYAVSLGSMKTNCGQWLIIFKEGARNPLHKLLRVDQSDDKDVSLDEIIHPWAGENA